MLKIRITSIFLLTIMVISIFKYQLPMVEYSLFKDYIAKNLCEKKDVKGNCCKGKCFMKKQMKLAVENENTTGNNTNPNNKKAQTYEINDFILIRMSELRNNEITKLLFFRLETVIASKTVSDIFVPPKILS